MKTKILFMTHASVIAAIYVILLILFAPISFMAIQVRVAEALSVLPFFTSAAIPGLFLGCLLGNLLAGADVLDIVIGSMTTLIAALMAYRMRANRFIVPLPAVILNALVIPYILRFAYHLQDNYLLLTASVFLGQFISAYLLGLSLLFTMEKINIKKFLQ